MHSSFFSESTPERQLGELTEKDLKKQILYTCNYDPEARPVENSSTCVRVKLECTLLQVVYVVSTLCSSHTHVSWTSTLLRVIFLHQTEVDVQAMGHVKLKSKQLYISRQ